MFRSIESVRDVTELLTLVKHLLKSPEVWAVQGSNGDNVFSSNWTYSKNQTEYERRDRRAQQSCLHLSNSTSNKRSGNKSWSRMIDEAASRLEMNVKSQFSRTEPGLQGGDHQRPPASPGRFWTALCHPLLSKSHPSSTQSFYRVKTLFEANCVFWGT